jgi:hypothetical protein
MDQPTYFFVDGAGAQHGPVTGIQIKARIQAPKARAHAA